MPEQDYFSLNVKDGTSRNQRKVSPILRPVNTQNSNGTSIPMVLSPVSSPGYSTTREINYANASNNSGSIKSNITNTNVLHPATNHSLAAYHANRHSTVSGMLSNSHHIPQNVLQSHHSSSDYPHQQFVLSPSKIEKKSKPPSPDQSYSTPTLVIPPDLASLTTTTTSDVNNSLNNLLPGQSHNASFSVNVPGLSNSNNPSNSNISLPSIPNKISAPSLTNSANGLPETNPSSNSSTRSFNVPHSTSSVNLRSYTKQYLVNEQNYLEKMKNRTHDDYYTRGIVASQLYDDDFDLDIDTEDAVLDSNYSGNDEYDFGTNFITSEHRSSDDASEHRVDWGRSELVASMSYKFLLHSMDWLKSLDPDDEIIRRVFQNLKHAPIISNDISSKFMVDSQIKNQLNLLVNHPRVDERLKWQAMLSNVLNGDIVRSEKTRIANQIKKPQLTSQFTNELWLELKAWMNGRPPDALSKSLKVLRENAAHLFQVIMDFKLDDSLSILETKKRISDVLDRYFKTINYWPNMKELNKAMPITNTPDFIGRVEVMVGWMAFKENFDLKITELKHWITGYEIEVKNVSNQSFMRHCANPDNIKSFAEQIIKEKDIENIFQRHIFFPLAPWILKAKLFNLKHAHLISEMKLNFPKSELEFLLLLPKCILKEIVLIRLAYAKKLNKPTMMMIDQTIDDFSLYIKLCVQMRFAVMRYCSDWDFVVDDDNDFDSILIEAIQHLFLLLNLKFLDPPKQTVRNLKEQETLLEYWENLRNVGYYVAGAGKIIATEFNRLTLRIINRLHAYLLQQQNNPPNFDNVQEAEKWLVQIFEYLGSMKRKLDRFSGLLRNGFQNSVHYKIRDHKSLLDALKNTGHFLLYTGGVLENKGIYLIASSELLGCDDKTILRILEGRDVGCDLVPKLEINNSLALFNKIDEFWDINSYLIRYTDSEGNNHYEIRNDHAGTYPRRQYGVRELGSHLPEYERSDTTSQSVELQEKLHGLGYLLVICPDEPMLWEGEMYNFSNSNLLCSEKYSLNIKQGSLVLLNQESTYSLEYQRERLQRIAAKSISFIEKRSTFNEVEKILQKINKAFYKFTFSVLKNHKKILGVFDGLEPDNELLNSVFLFSRDFGRHFLRTSIANIEKKSLIALLLNKLCISWLQFLIEKCNPNDQRTFRWCVSAMEFTMQMTSRWNILALNEEEFTLLKLEISSCMSLLISHFDVMGARATEAEKSVQQSRFNLDLVEDFDAPAILRMNSKLRLEAINKMEGKVQRNPRSVGKVIDATDKGGKYLSLLASSLSNVSMRWQKRNFVGNGSFGTVYSAVNLDNGELLAVKEIKIQESATMKKVFLLLKKEMSVLEMLNHPNIVQYYGVEIHRDRVNIFMEYCEGGSLGNLLEHGRIEDEMVTQVYSLELLEGLAYLHQLGVVHRDIKPENILLDCNGIIKYVDFGAARKISQHYSRKLPSRKSKDGGSMAQKYDGMDDNEDATESQTLHDMMGTPMYMAPESITGSNKKGKLGADDVWSLGCVILEMITGRRPWANLDNEWAIMYQVAAGHTPPLPQQDEVSEAGMKFLCRCLVQDPQKRASAVELLLDPWIVEIREMAFGSGENDDKSNTTVDNTIPIKQEIES